MSGRQDDFAAETVGMKIGLFGDRDIDRNGFRNIDRCRCGDIIIESLAEFVARNIPGEFTGIDEVRAVRMRHDRCSGDRFGMVDAAGMVHMTVCQYDQGDGGEIDAGHDGL